MEYKNITLPDDLRDLTIDFMKGIIDTFDKENKLNNLDALSLYLLAGNFNLYLECEEQIKKNGMVQFSDRGNMSLSSYAVQQKQLQSSIITILKEMGLTLGSRTKMKDIQTDLEDSPLAGFLGRNDK